MEKAENFDQNVDSILFWTGSYVAAHKYFGVDYRKDKSTPEFYRNFPIPVLKHLHSELQTACEESVYACLKHVYITAYQSSTMFELHRLHFSRFEEINYPFINKYEMFRYRTTASYYLCYYTLRRKEVLSRVYPNCLSYFSSGENIYDANGNHINDIRQAERKPLSCAKRWFCPDPCYGRASSGSVADLVTDLGNPCFDLPNNNCVFPGELNIHFEALIRNKLNFSCDCSAEMKGYSWNIEYRTCLDTDECQTENAKCPSGKTCINTEGSYRCQ